MIQQANNLAKPQSQPKNDKPARVIFMQYSKWTRNRFWYRAI